MKELSISPRVRNKELIRLLGGRKNGRLSWAIKSKVEGFTAGLRRFLRPKVHYKIKPLARTTKTSIELEKGPVFRSRKIARTLTRCGQVVCFVATIGRRLEDLIQDRFRSNRVSEAYILDALGSVLVEDVARQFHEYMAKKCALRQEEVTLRFSPGYCDWPLEEQRKLFSVFNPSRLSVRLSKSCLMEPRKSISGIFGILSLEENLHYTPYNPCTECGKRECNHRRAPYMGGTG